MSSSRLEVLGSLGMLAILFVSLLASGGAVAQTSNELVNETRTVDGDTQQIYLEVTDTSGDALNYSVEGINGSSVTEVDTGQISAATNDTTRQEWDVDSSSYDEYRVVVMEDGSDADSESLESYEVGLVEDTSTSNGGGIFGSGSSGLFSPVNIVILILLLGAAYVLGLFGIVQETWNDVTEG